MTLWELTFFFIEVFFLFTRCFAKESQMFFPSVLACAAPVQQRSLGPMGVKGALKKRTNLTYWGIARALSCNKVDSPPSSLPFSKTQQGFRR